MLDSTDKEQGNMIGSTFGGIIRAKCKQQGAKAQNTLSGKWDVLFAVLLSNLAGTLLYAASGLAATIDETWPCKCIVCRLKRNSKNCLLCIRRWMTL